MDDVFAPQVTLHGTLADVHGIGLLFKGRSAIGKSEVGLDLVERGHRLVADDAVNITRKSQGILVGTSSRTAPRPHGNSRYRNHGHKENVRCARDSETEEDRSSRSIGGLGRDNVVPNGLALRTRPSSLGVELPEVTIPLFPGKNITVIVEAIAMDYLLRIEGHYAARELNKRLIESMNKKS